MIYIYNQNRMEKQNELMRKQLDKINDNLELIHENIDQTNEKLDEVKKATKDGEGYVGCLFSCICRLLLIIIALIVFYIK